MGTADDHLARLVRELDPASGTPDADPPHAETSARVQELLS